MTLRICLGIKFKSKDSVRDSSCAKVVSTFQDLETCRTHSRLSLFESDHEDFAAHDSDKMRKIIACVTLLEFLILFFDFF